MCPLCDTPNGDICAECSACNARNPALPDNPPSSPSSPDGTDHRAPAAPAGDADSWERDGQPNHSVASALYAVGSRYDPQAPQYNRGRDSDGASAATPPWHGDVDGYVAPPERAGERARETAQEPAEARARSALYDLAVNARNEPARGRATAPRERSASATAPSSSQPPPPVADPAAEQSAAFSPPCIFAVRAIGPVGVMGDARDWLS